MVLRMFELCVSLAVFGRTSNKLFSLLCPESLPLPPGSWTKSALGSAAPPHERSGTHRHFITDGVTDPTEFFASSVPVAASGKALQWMGVPPSRWNLPFRYVQACTYVPLEMTRSCIDSHMHFRLVEIVEWKSQTRGLEWLYGSRVQRCVRN